MKKILIIEGRESIGGGQVVTKHICDILSVEKYDVSVFIPGENNDISRLLSDYKQYHYRLIPYSNGKKQVKDYFSFFYNTLCIYRVLYKLLKDERYDLLYIQHQNILPVCILANRNIGINIISHLHVVYIDKLTRRMINYILRNKYVKRIFGVSEYTLSQLAMQNIKKSIVLYNPILIKEKKDINNASHRIAIIGDVVEFKGHHVLFKAMQFLPNDCEIYVIGNLLDKIYLRKLQSFSVRCTYTGLIPNVTDYLIENEISLVIIPSISPFETFSLSMTESWALGIPTIATNDYGMKELVKTFLPQYQDDMLFIKEDEIDLTNKILGLYTNECLYQEISSAVYNVIKNSLNVEKFKETLLKEVSQII